ncbi:MAG: hypothetical protein K0Q93_2237 [Nocardioidaceae bacterium]|jgi:hypothetical protein|nr:hypothetical protein [Nocardioidaceae bacterium]
MSDPADRGLVVVDIDGVVADVAHRLPHLRGRPKNWDAFFAAMADDPLLVEGAAAVTRAAADHDLVWVTGRPARYADVTAKWLAARGLPAAPVHHRPDGDRRPADVVKREIVRRLARSRRVALVIDDDVTVCATLRAAGFTVFQADWAASAGTAPALRRAQHEEGRT